MRINQLTKKLIEGFKNGILHYHAVQYRRVLLPFSLQRQEVENWKEISQREKNVSRLNMETLAPVGSEGEKYMKSNFCFSARV
jgi:hypothetical protein